MTGAAVLRARRTRAGLAQSQGARGWARSQSSSVLPRVPRPPPPLRPPPLPPRVLAIPGATISAPGEVWGTSGIYGAPASQAGFGGFAGPQGHAGGAGLVVQRRVSGRCISEDVPPLRGEYGKQGPDLRPRGPRGPAPILSLLLPQPPLLSVLDANLCCKI